MHNTKVKDIMTANPVIIAPGTTLLEAAKKMKEIECGILPVGTNDKIVGMITDRDIVIRALAEEKDPAKEKVENHMTETAYACNEEDFLEDAADKMRTHKVSRLVVKNKQGQVTGILSFGGILRKHASSEEIANIIKHAINRKAA